MSSTAVHIPNMLEAITAGTVPGSWSEDRTTFSFPTLAYVGSRGATHLWTVRVRLIGSDADEYYPIEDEMLDQPAYDLEDLRAEITTESQQVGGKIRDIIPTYVSTGKNLGKKNATNALTQALRDALGQYNKHKKRVDVADAADVVAATSAAATKKATPTVKKVAPTAKKAAPASNSNDGGDDDGDETPSAKFDEMPPPMLVKKIGDSREATLTPADFANGVTAQRKLNGVHFVTFMRDGKLVCYSRTGTTFPVQAQVDAELTVMFETAPPIAPGEFGTMPFLEDHFSERDRRCLESYGVTFDEENNQTLGDPRPYFAGELYLHGKPLQWISGQARRGDNEGQLQYHIFDVFFPHAKEAGFDMLSRHRQAYIDAFFAASPKDSHPHVIRVANTAVKSLAELNRLAKSFLDEGYEGAIARKDGVGYRYSYSNYHSANLVKIKPIHDAEFPVVGFAQGTKGKDVGAVIWECEVPNPVDENDKTFSVVPKDMTYDDRRAIFTALNKKVKNAAGKLVTRFERDIKGLPLTVEYAEISAKTGKPLQAKALAFRTYEGGPDADPVKKLLDDAL
jgi:hypothetical protein